MDWTPYMSGLFALGGALVGAIAVIGSQIVLQRSENKRVLQRIAYETAAREWEYTVSMAEKVSIAAGKECPVKPIEDFVMIHLLWTQVFADAVAGKKKAEDFPREAVRIAKLQETMHGTRNELEAYRMEKFPPKLWKVQQAGKGHGDKPGQKP